MAQDARQQERAKQWGQVVARAWSDETFKQRLLAEPKAVLAEAGLPIPPNVTVLAHEATPTHLHLVLPSPPQGRDGDKLTEAELEQVAGGGWEVSIESLFDWIGCAIGVYC
jgi:Nitrile hydratase, alpha chain